MATEYAQPTSDGRRRVHRPAQGRPPEQLAGGGVVGGDGVGLGQPGIDRAAGDHRRGQRADPVFVAAAIIEQHAGHRPGRARHRPAHRQFSRQGHGGTQRPPGVGHEHRPVPCDRQRIPGLAGSAGQPLLVDHRQGGLARQALIAARIVGAVATDGRGENHPLSREDARPARTAVRQPEVRVEVLVVPGQRSLDQPVAGAARHAALASIGIMPNADLELTLLGAGLGIEPGNAAAAVSADVEQFAIAIQDAA